MNRTALVICAVLTAAPMFAQSTNGMAGFDVQGHRGARGLAPENSIPGFLAAIEIGVTTLELDVVISADSVVVVSHEPWMSSEICSLPSGEPVPENPRDKFNLFSMTLDEIRRFDCGSRGNPRFPEQEKTPTNKPPLSGVIEAAEAWTSRFDLPPVGYNIETKSSPAGDGIFHPEPETFVRLLLNAVEEGGVIERTTIQSFDFRTLREARRQRPEVGLSLLTTEDLTDGFEADVERLGFVPDIYSPDYRLVTPEIVAQAKEAAVRVIPWTVNEWEDMVRLKKMGVDGLITDYPNVGVKLLGR